MRLVQALIPVGKRYYSSWKTLWWRRDRLCRMGRNRQKGLWSPCPVSSSSCWCGTNTYQIACELAKIPTTVLTPETIISRRIEVLKQRYSGTRISREELITRAENLAPETSTYLAFLVLSTIIATGGLLLDSAATIIGAMVVAPLMGPAISASVDTVLDRCCR